MIHPTAIIDPAAEIADGVEIGAYSVIGSNVQIGKGSVLKSHVVIEGRSNLSRCKYRTDRFFKGKWCGCVTFNLC